MKKLLKLLIILLIVACAVNGYAQKKKHAKKEGSSSSKHSSSKSSSGKHSSSKSSSGKHSGSKSSGSKHSSSKSSSGKRGKKGSSKERSSSRHGRHHHYSDEEGPHDEVIVKGESNSINWIYNDDAVTFMVPSSYLQSHAYVRNTTDNPLNFAIYEDGHWVEKTLPAKTNTDVSAAESRRFKMDANGKPVETILYPGHFYNVIVNPGNTSDIKDVTETVTVN